MRTYTESLCCRERNDITVRNEMMNGTFKVVFLGNEYSPEFFQTLLEVPHFSNVARKS